MILYYEIRLSENVEYYNNGLPEDLRRGHASSEVTLVEFCPSSTLVISHGNKRVVRFSD